MRTILACLLAACSAAPEASDGGPDARRPIDAPIFDARPDAFHADASHVDAPPGTPDAAVVDAAAGAPDAIVADAGPTNRSLRFYGTNANQVDRVEIQIDPPVPADIGAGNFTIELWMKSPAGTKNCFCTTVTDNWIAGNIMIDRDIFGVGDFGDYGISVCGSGLAFGVRVAADGSGICSSPDVADNTWHHVAFTRRASDGQLTIFVDGKLDVQGLGPPGDASYRDGRNGVDTDPFLVIGCEKHDVDTPGEGYKGLVDELRLSTTLRYTANFTPPTAPFAVDAGTAALYHFDEGTGTTIVDAKGTSPGQRLVGGAMNGPTYETDTPFN